MGAEIALMLPKRQKKYARVFIFPWCSCNLKPRLSEDGAEIYKRKQITFSGERFPQQTDSVE